MEDRTSPAAAGFLGSSDGLPTSEQEDRARPLPSASVRAPGGASDEASEASDDISILGYPFSILETMELPKFVKQHNNSLTFPQKLMIMLSHVERSASNQIRDREAIGWVEDGDAFVIRDKDVVVNHWLPLFFPRAKFSSFTRKLYRWGFRLLCSDAGDSQPGDLHFRCAHFQRNRKGLMSNMKSVTAEARRRNVEERPRDRNAPTLANPITHSPLLYSMIGQNRVSLAVQDMNHSASTVAPAPSNLSFRFDPSAPRNIATTASSPSLDPLVLAALRGSQLNQQAHIALAQHQQAHTTAQNTLIDTSTRNFLLSHLAQNVQGQSSRIPLPYLQSLQWDSPQYPESLLVERIRHAMQEVPALSEEERLQLIIRLVLSGNLPADSLRRALSRR